MSRVKIFTLLFVILLFILFFCFDLDKYLSLETFIDKKQEFDSFYKNSPILFVSAFFAFYVFCMALSIPGAALLSLVAGFLFDFFLGSLVVSFGATIGATFAFLISRFLLKDFIERKFQSRLQKISEGFKKDGVFLFIFL